MGTHHRPKACRHVPKEADLHIAFALTCIPSKLDDCRSPSYECSSCSRDFFHPCAPGKRQSLMIAIPRNKLGKSWRDHLILLSFQRSNQTSRSWILSLEATHSRSPGLGVNLPGHRVGVELSSAKKPYLQRDIAWDRLSFFTLMKGLTKNLIRNRAAGQRGLSRIHKSE